MLWLHAAIANYLDSALDAFCAVNTNCDAPMLRWTNSLIAWRIKYALLTPKRPLIVSIAAAADDSMRTEITFSLVAPIAFGLPLFAMHRQYCIRYRDVNRKLQLS
jgi:hypothetical protein